MRSAENQCISAKLLSLPPSGNNSILFQGEGKLASPKPLPRWVYVDIESHRVLAQDCTHGRAHILLSDPGHHWLFSSSAQN